MNILLVCATGMSTSLLVSKMEKSAKEQDKDYNIWAVSGRDLSSDIDKADAVLLGPQARYMLADVKKTGEKKNIPVDMINPQHYGMANGPEVLKTAEALVLGDNHG
ncbi:PTS sugar transporter subunit IIB [Salicibibacter cibi]|uniref:PTS sugar transporter subunit IIB n=1 Tax=Salicibibacter cibi TaxID=2743001 RepID=A0A7T6ZBL5_9BACI|nr:PTS sugar transporter subunit IIB [Salicibibacter cibi]QQK80392.1 PTS sugar transporter subunit IIB [Salicibibacter cibi]